MNPDEFKDVFIMFGAFHIEGSIFFLLLVNLLTGLEAPIY